MEQRGRKSADSLAVSLNDSHIIERPDAPYDLTDEQADMWRMVVASKPADHFSPDLFPLLASYCRHIVEARHISQLIEQAKFGSELDVPEYDRLCKMRERETRAAASMAIKTGLTNSEDRKAKRRAPLKAAPWQK